jgi:hypothetical protein
MKPDVDLGWKLIEHDPMLRQELSCIEQHSIDDEMIDELMEFYARIERMMRLSAVVAEEDLPSYRLT